METEARIIFGAIFLCTTVISITNIIIIGMLCNTYKTVKTWEIDVKR